MRQLYVDNDGVSADFYGHYARLFDTPPLRGRGGVDWDAIERVSTFFLDLPPYPGLQEFWDGLRRFHPDPIVLTGLHERRPGVERQKREWVAHHIGDRVQVICTRFQQKQTVARPGDVLVDDWIQHRDPWERAGGIFVLHRSFDATLLELENIYGH